MKTRLLLSLLAGLGLLAAVHHDSAIVTAQDSGGIIKNPELYLPTSPRARVEDDVLYKVREARKREHEALALTDQGKTDDAFDKWRDAFGRYQHLREEFLKDDLPRNSELLVRAESFEDLPESKKRELDVYSETWIPLADYLNSRFRIRDWPPALKNRLALQQAAKGADMLKRALDNDDPYLLRRCARFYQFSQAGRTALKLLAAQALEQADSVNAVRWLEEYFGSWTDEFVRDPALQLQYVRACRDAGMSYRLGRMLRHLERMGFSGQVDVGGVKYDSLEYIKKLVEENGVLDHPELDMPGWRTLQGGVDRNGVAPPVTELGEMIDLDGAEGLQGFKLIDKVPGLEQDPNNYSGEEPPPLPVVFPTVHESGFFVHRVSAGENDNERLMWFRHGNESKPLPLEVQKALRYTPRPQNRNRWWRGGMQNMRNKYRVMSSSIGRLRWELDNREDDVLFAVLGKGSPTREKTGDPTGNQIQAFDLGRDAALRVTLPNKKVEENGGDWDFLKDVVFSGAPLIRNNKLYIAGCYTVKDSFEVWMFCFDVTPKGDPSQGEGKLVWRTQLCSKKLAQAPWGGWGGNEPVELPEISSISEQGGMLYCCTHTGAIGAVDRVTGELCWVSRYGRENAGMMRGWFPNAPLAAGGFVVTAPYDHRLAIILDAVTGTHWMEYPLKGKGAIGEYEHLLGVVDNCLLVQGRSRLYSVALTSFRKGGIREANFGSLQFQAEYSSGEQPTGRGVIAGGSVLVPFGDEIAVYNVTTGKLTSKFSVNMEKAGELPVTLTVYTRGESYKDEQGITRYKPVTLTDPKSGNVYNVEHLANGSTFTFPSGETAVVKKETYVIVASAQWVYVFQAKG